MDGVLRDLRRAAGHCFAGPPYKIWPPSNGWLRSATRDSYPRNQQL